jgi:anti-sigma B factor antagonist
VQSDQERSPVAGFHARLVAQAPQPTVAVRGFVDLSTAPALAAAIDAAICAGPRIELDLRETTFMDSAGLVVLRDAHVRLGQVREAIVLVDPSPEVRRILELAGLADLFRIVTRPRRAGDDGSDSSTRRDGPRP